MFAVAVNGDTPFAIVILQEQRTIHAGPRASPIFHGCTARKKPVTRRPLLAASRRVAMVVGSRSFPDERDLQVRRTIFFLVETASIDVASAPEKHVAVQVDQVVFHEVVSRDEAEGR